MFELDFCGFASLPGSSLGECLDAAGIDASLAGHGRRLAVDDAPSRDEGAAGRA